MHILEFLFITNSLFGCTFFFPFCMTNGFTHGIGCTTNSNCTTSNQVFSTMFGKVFTNRLS